VINEYACFFAKWLFYIDCFNNQLGKIIEKYLVLGEIVLGEIALDEMAVGEIPLGEIAGGIISHTVSSLLK
jgi:hypothetical protein